MIKIKHILKEISRERLLKKAYSWQRPDGTFVPIRYSHGSDAFQMGGQRPNEDHIMNFWKLGWQRVTYEMSNGLYAHNEVIIPNDRQKQKLIDLAKSLDIEKVEWDGGDNNKILWSIHDQLQ